MKLRVWLFFTLTASSHPLLATPPGKMPPAVERFEERYHSARTLKADFLERYLENGKEVRSEAGVAYFGKPGKMRWEYESPERNLFVIDGKWSWFYVPADHAATRIRARNSSDWRTPLALLAGEMKVARVCQRVEQDSSSRPLAPGALVFRCVLRGSPREADKVAGDASVLYDSRAESVAFELNPATGELLRILAVDPGGVQIEFRFAHWEFGPAIASSEFRFDPPRGVAIIDGELGASGGEKGESVPAATVQRKSH